MRGIIYSLLLLTACATDDEGEPRCTDPKYGDGTCDPELACEAPDIDCFVTFDDQASAQAWYATSPAAASAPALPVTDPRYAPMRALLDRGWAAYQQSHAVGDLALHDVELVVVQPPALNHAAFVESAENRTKEALLVAVETQLLDLHAPDEQVLGIVMHELQHAIGLHSVTGVAERIRKYYTAPTGATPEPFGSDQPDDAATRHDFEAWAKLADDAGYLTDVELRGLPHGGVLDTIFQTANATRAGIDPAGCAPSVNALVTLRQSIGMHANILDDSIDLTMTNAPTVIVNALNDLQAKCYATVTADAITVAAQILHLDEAALRASLPADLRAMIEGKPFVTGLYNWESYDRANMRAIEASFSTRTGLPWERLRYFSTEEAADDSSVITLHAMGLPADGIGKIIPTLVPGLEAICRPLVDAMQPIPYGENLPDIHHGSCWRAGHAAARAAALPAKGKRASNRLVLAPPRTRSFLAGALAARGDVVDSSR